MADSTISQLPAAVALTASDLIPVDQGGVTKKAALGLLGNNAIFLAYGKTLTVNSTLTFTGTDGTVITFPATSASMARTDAAQSFTGLQTFLNGLATTTGSFSDQLTSTVSTGTAPLVIASTTPVANLSIGGNSATATALETARTIDGVSFDGTANITVVGPATNASPSKTTPVDADKFTIYDSVSTLLAHVTWANIKATMKAYFDPIYAAIAGSASQVFSVAAATAAAHAVRADQIQGASLTAYTTGGSATAYTITPSPAITAYTANQTFNVIFNAANGAAPTLQISGVATPPNLVRQLNDGSYQNLAANAFPSGWQSEVKMVGATQALVLTLPRRSKTISATRLMSAASGDVAYTGCGFVPRKITAFVSVPGEAGFSSGVGSIGGEVCLYRTSDAAYNSTADKIIFITDNAAPAKVQSATIASINLDGFTLAWTNLNNPAGVTANLKFFVEE